MTLFKYEHMRLLTVNAKKKLKTITFLMGRATASFQYQLALYSIVWKALSQARALSWAKTLSLTA
jgi:hypothetical protein